ncbi:MAG: serine/threonine-protein kinase [Myxococcota bacterium]
MSDDPLAFAPTECGPTPRAADSGNAPSPPELTPGTKFGRYVIERKIGAGGMGMVFAAHDPELERLVAIKVMRPRALRTRKEALAHVMHGLFGDEPASEPTRTVEETRLLREAQAAAALSHPNVVTINDVGRGDAGIFIAMEFIEGRTLREWLTEKARRADKVLEVFLDAARGLAAAHDAGLVHRDFKPDNVMVADDGRVVVVDFGLVGPAMADESDPGPTPALDALSEELTHEGSVLGTPAYMAPEQHYGTATDPRTDQFSFCVSLWEALVGARPFRLAIPDLLDGSPAWPNEERRFPRWRFDVVRRGLSLMPGDRWPSMDALIDALQADPTRARRRRRQLIGVGALAVAGVVGWQGRNILARRRCELDASRIDEVWNDAARQRVTLALTATGASYAEETATKFAAQVDALTDEWRTTRSEACLTAAFGEDPEGLLPGTIRCLDASAKTLTSLLDAARSVDLGGLRGALSATASMGRPSRCADRAAATRYLEAPPSATGTAAEIRAELLRSETLEAMGRYAEALQLARAAAGRAEAHAQPTFIAAAQLQLGIMLERTGEHDAAVTTLEDAANAAAEVGDDGDAARAAIRLAFVLARWKSDAERALHWARWAESFLERTEARDLEAARSLHGELGSVYGYAGDVQQQLVHHERQVELAREQLTARHPGLLPGLNNLGSSLTDVGRNEEALTLLEEAVAIQDAALPANHPDVAMTMTNIAQLYWLADRSDDALAAAKRALDIFTDVLGPDHPRVGTSHANYGLVLEQLGRGEEALTQFERAAEVARANGENTVDIAVALANLGDSERRLGRPEQALAHIKEAMEILDAQTGHELKQRATVAHGIGNDLRSLERYDEALPQFETAREILAGALPDGDPRLAIVDLSIGRTLGDLDRGAEAKTALDRAVSAFEGGNAAPGKIASARFALTRALELTGDLAAARRHAEAVAAMERAPAETREEAKRWLAAHE